MGMSIGLAVVLALAIGGILAIVIDHLQEMEKIRLKAEGRPTTRQVSSCNRRWHR